jgi:ELWxxDGT repeat protein
MHLGAVRVLTWSTVLSLSLAWTALAQPVFQVKDINTNRPNAEGPPLKAELAEFGLQIVFTASDSVHGTELWITDGTELWITDGTELWITDGTEVGTRILKDICPGVCSSLPSELTTVGSQVLFVADDGAHGRELWSTNLAGANVQMVADLNPGLPGSSISSLVEFQGALLFAASDPAHGIELWKSDGTAAGTTRLADIHPGTGSSRPSFWTAMGSSLYLLADDGAHGRELWKTDGTAAGTALVKDTLAGSDSGFPETLPFSPYGPVSYPFAPFSGKLFFPERRGTARRGTMVHRWHRQWNSPGIGGPHCIQQLRSCVHVRH